MIKKILVLFFISLLILNFFTLNSNQSKAEETGGWPAEPIPLETLREAAPGIGPGREVTEETLITYIGKIIQLALSFVGIILFLVILYGGFLWMTAGGNEEQVTKARTWIKNGVIGLIIIIASYAISAFVIQQLMQI